MLRSETFCTRAPHDFGQSSDRLTTYEVTSTDAPGCVSQCNELRRYAMHVVWLETLGHGTCGVRITPFWVLLTDAP